MCFASTQQDFIPAHPASFWGDDAFLGVKSPKNETDRCLFTPKTGRWGGWWWLEHPQTPTVGVYVPFSTGFYPKPGGVRCRWFQSSPVLSFPPQPQNWGSLGGVWGTRLYRGGGTGFPPASPFRGDVVSPAAASPTRDPQANSGFDQIWGVFTPFSPARSRCSGWGSIAAVVPTG